MPSFMQAIKGYQKDNTTKVNPPEAVKVLEEKSAPEVAGKAPPVESAAAPESSASSEAQPVVSSESEAPKAKRGRPAGSKNAPKPAAAEPASVPTTDAVPYAEGNSLADAIALVRDLLPAGASLTIVSGRS